MRRRPLAIEKLGAADKRQVLQIIDTFIERGQLKAKVQQRSARSPHTLCGTSKAACLPQLQRLTG